MHRYLEKTTLPVSGVRVTERPRYGIPVNGFGKKIPTSIMLRIGVRWHRVYCAIFGNNGTCYIVINGEDVLLWHDTLRGLCEHYKLPYPENY